MSLVHLGKMVVRAQAWDILIPDAMVLYGE